MAKKKPNWMNKGEKNISKLSVTTKRNLGLNKVKAHSFKSQQDYSPSLTELYDKEDISKHLLEFYVLLRKIAKNIFLATMLVFILPGFEKGNFTISPFKPLVLQVLNGIIAHIFNSFSDGQSVEIFIGSPLTPISMYINLALFMGTVLALPYTIIQSMEFIKPGLKEKEIEVLYTIGKSSLILFLIGVLISYIFILPNTLKILAGSGGFIGDATLLQMYSLQSVINLMLWGTLGGGLLYTSPLILVALVNMKVIETKTIENRRKEILMMVFTLAAFITPDPTIVSMLVLSLPMIVIIEFMITWSYKIELQQLFEGDINYD